MSHLRKSKPIVAYKRLTNIHDMQIHSKMNKSAVSYNVTKCNRRHCSHCLTINESDCFTSSTTSCVHKIRQNLSCISTDVIYFITSKKCEAQHVGQTHQKCANRINNHRFDIVHFPDMLTNVSEHFNSPGHNIQDFSFMPIEKVSNNWKRLLKETSWITFLAQLLKMGWIKKYYFDS